MISIDVKLTGKQELNWFENNRILGTLRPNMKCTGLFKMIVGVLTTCHTQYT